MIKNGIYLFDKAVILILIFLSTIFVRAVKINTHIPPGYIISNYNKSIDIFLYWKQIFTLSLAAYL